MIGSQRMSSHGQQLVARERLRFVPELQAHQREGNIRTDQDRAFVRDTTRGHHSSIDLTLEGERLVVPPKIAEADRDIS